MKLLSPRPIKYLRRSKKRQWKAVLCEDVLFDLGYDAGQGEARTPNGRLLASWNKNVFIIYLGYAWDLMTGWIDTEDNAPASLAHDAGYQFSNCPNSPFSKKRVDSWLYDLQTNRFQARTTLFGVQLFGRFFWKHGETDCHVTIMKAPTEK